MPKNHTPEAPKRQPGSRKLSKSQLKGLQNAHKRHIIPDRGGWHVSRAAQDWVRPGYETQCPMLRGTELMSAVIFMAFRQNKPWNSSDGMTISDLVARSFGADYLARRRLNSRPAWLENVVRGLHEGATMPYKSGYLEFVGDLLRAKRVGAVSIFISQTEAGNLYGCNERTFRRWVILAEDLGVVTMVQTWKRNNGVRRGAHRRFGKIAYIAGPRLVEVVGPAIYEGLDEAQLAGGKRTCTAARRRAQDLRKASVEDFRQGRDAAWRRKNGRPDPISLSPDIVPAPPSPFGSEIGGSRSESGKERPSAASMPASPDRGEKLPAPDRAEPGVASPETNANSENRETSSPDRGTERLASKSMHGAGSAVPSMLEAALARMEAEAKRLRRAMFLLVFFLLTLTMGCGARLDGQTKTNGVIGNRPSGGSHGVSHSAAGAGEAPDGRDTRRWKDRGYPRVIAGRSASHDHENDHQSRPAGRSQQIHKHRGKKMDKAESEQLKAFGTDVPDILQGDGVGALVSSDEDPKAASDRRVISGQATGSAANFAWETAKPYIVQMRRISGRLTKVGSRDKPSQNAKIEGYAFIATVPGSKWKFFDRVPGRLGVGIHRVRVSSDEADVLDFRLNCVLAEADAPARLQNERESEQSYPHGASTGDDLVREANIGRDAFGGEGDETNPTA